MDLGISSSLLGGIGLFLLGMLLITNGLRLAEQSEKDARYLASFQACSPAEQLEENEHIPTNQ